MAPRVFDDRLEIHLSVRDLVPADPAEPFAPGGGFLATRLADGAAIHREIASEHERAGAGFRKEVSVRFDRAVDGWTVRVRGRIDGVHVGPDGVPVVEEVKTVASIEGDPARLAAFRDQALMYAFLLDHALRLEAGASPRARVLLVERASRARRVVELDYDREAVESDVSERLRAIVAEAVAGRVRRERRALFASRLRFPFGSLRPGQDGVIAAIDEALESGRHLLVAAPAGLGKTAAALFPAVRHALRTGRRVFYATAKTLQAENARRVLEAFRDQGVDLASIVLRAKEKVCLNDVVVCREERCAHARDYTKKLLGSGALSSLPGNGVVTGDRVMEAGHRHEICPFQLSLDLTRDADVIVGDYNYVFDPRVSLRHLFADGGDGDFVLVVDEAHNLPARAAEYYSPRLFRRPARKILRETPPGPNGFRKRLRSVLRAVDSIFASIGDASAPLFRDKREAAAWSRIEIDPAPFRALRPEAEAVLLERLLLAAEERRSDPDDPVAECLFDLLRFEWALSLGGDEFSHFRGEDENGECLRVLCKDASRFLAERMKGFRSVIAMSATLKPFAYYRVLLGLEPARTLEAEFPSPFPPENRRILVLPEVSTIFRHRERAAPRIAEILSEAARLRAGNYVAFFPSFEFLRKVSARIDRRGLEILEQRESMDDRERSRLLDALAAPASESRLVLAVQGGVFAEGVDFAGDLCVGVFVVGPALPKMGPEREEIRRHFEERFGRGFEYAYLYPGMSRVVQAAGRLLRSESDRGIVLLLCNRFAQRAYAELFPRDWYERSPAELVSRDWRADVERFWATLPARPRPGHLF